MPQNTLSKNIGGWAGARVRRVVVLVADFTLLALYFI